MSDYIHRAGRVGRIQSRGTGFILNFIINPWEVELVWKIEVRQIFKIDMMTKFFCLSSGQLEKLAH